MSLSPKQKTKVIMHFLKERQGNVCYYCEKPFTGCENIEHIIPLKLGGSGDPSNLAAVHRKCNDEVNREFQLMYPEIYNVTKED